MTASTEELRGELVSLRRGIESTRSGYLRDLAQRVIGGR